MDRKTRKNGYIWLQNGYTLLNSHSMTSMMCKRRREHTDYSGMTVNERLFVSGRLGDFEAAVKEGSRKRVSEILKELQVSESDAIHIIDVYDGNRRVLSEDEKRLLSGLLKKANINKPDSWMDSLLIMPMDDGGMGSYYISDESYTQLASDILFKDEDSVEVLATLYVNSNGEPCEVDMWKMNYSRVKRIPSNLEDQR